MATKKAGGSRAAEPNAQAFTVLLEDIRGQFSVFGEALQGLHEHMDERFDAVDTRFEGVDARLDRMDARFDGVDARLDRVDARLNGVDARLETTDQTLGMLKAAVLDNSRELKEHGLLLAEHGRLLAEHGLLLAEHGHELKQIRQAGAITSRMLDEKVGHADVGDIVERAVQKQRR